MNALKALASIISMCNLHVIFLSKITPRYFALTREFYSPSTQPIFYTYIHITTTCFGLVRPSLGKLMKLHKNRFVSIQPVKIFSVVH
jgi:hypothetical protein